MKQSFRNVPWGRLLSVLLAATLLFTSLETSLFVQAAEGGTISIGTVEDLQKAGLVFDEVILGGMAAKAGRKKFNKNVSASEEEVACMRRIMEKGTRMVFQLVPDETPVDVAKLV